MGIEPNAALLAQMLAQKLVGVRIQDVHVQRLLLQEILLDK